MKHFCIGLCFLALCLLPLPLPLAAEEALVFSYVRTREDNASWAVVPVLVDLPNRQGVSLFDALRQRKRPTYGTTNYDPNKQTVVMDETKCAFGAIIAAEVYHTFLAHGLKVPQISCRGQAVAAHAGALAHYVLVLPLWQALSVGEPPHGALAGVGAEVIPLKVFESRLAARDKAILAAIDSALEDRDPVVQFGTMQAVLARQLPQAESKVARQLDASRAEAVQSAFRALLQTKDGKILARMRELIEKSTVAEGSLAEFALGAADASLRDAGVVRLLTAGTDTAFDLAFAQVLKDRRLDLLPPRLDAILKANSPAKAREITAFLVSAEALAPVGQWLETAQPQAVSQAVAETAIDRLPPGQRPPLYVQAHGLLLASDDFDKAERAFFELTGESAYDMTPCSTPFCTAARADAMHRQAVARAANHPHHVIRHAAAQWLDETSAQQEPDADALKQAVYATDPEVRRAAARALSLGDAGLDPLRSILLRDSDARVSEAMVLGLANLPESPFARDLIQHAKTAPLPVRLAILRILPAIMTANTAHTIAAFVANEAFDPDIDIKISAIHALAQIALRSADPIIADNAITSLALTTQDKDPRIVHHTLLALARTQSPSVRDIFASALQTHPKSAIEAILRYRTEVLVETLQDYAKRHPDDLDARRALSML